MRRALPTSILLGQLASHLLLVLVVAGALVFYVVSAARGELEAEVGRKLCDIARIAARDVPLERLTLIRPGSEQTRMVRRLHQKLLAVQRSTGVASVEVCGAAGETLLDPAGRKIGAPCGRGPPASARPRLAAGEAVSTGSFREGDARYMAAFAPIVAPGGELFAVVGVRAGAGEVEVAVAMERRLYVAAGLTALLGALLGLLLAAWITRPIRQVAATADEIGRGHYTARVALPSTRELAVLAQSINTMAAQVESRERELRATGREQEHLLQTLAHEIRTPLARARFVMEALSDADSLDSVAEELGELDVEVTEVERLVEEVLGGLTAGREVDARRPLGVRALVEEVLSRAPAAPEGVEVEVVGSEADAVEVLVEPAEFERVLRNLLGNAVEHARARVRVELQPQDEVVVVAVCDDGPGVAAADRSKVLQPFARLESPRRARRAGLGLGLAIANRVCVAYGGPIVVGEADLGGARFETRWPVAEP